LGWGWDIHIFSQLLHEQGRDAFPRYSGRHSAGNMLNFRR
jgi:hypothetical protein